MIPANELRIGNLYISDCEHYLSELDDKFEKLDAILRDDKWKGGFCLEATNGNKTAITNSKPIPLTKEILEKLGCNCEKLNYHYILNINTEELGKNSNCLKIHFYLYNGISTQQNLLQIGECLPASVIEIKYLHRLQNLYFALTGKELEITLNPL